MRQLRLAIVALLFCAGCGSSGPAIPKTFPVKGKVTFADGTPLPTAAVRLANLDTRFSTAGVTKADGTFELKTFNDQTSIDGALEGEHTFEISGGPLENNRPLQTRVLRPATITVEPKDNEVVIEVERVGK
jgi:hypothetical protein